MSRYGEWKPPASNAPPATPTEVSELVGPLLERLRGSKIGRSSATSVPPVAPASSGTITGRNAPTSRSSSPSSGVKLSRRTRRREQRGRYIASLEARGARGCRPRDFKARTQAGVRAVFENRSGREARLALQRFPRSMRVHLVDVARHPGNGRELAADLHEQWSRWVIAVALLLWSERRSSRRHGFRAVMDGFTQGMICGLFRNRDGEAYSRSRVFGTSYRAGSDECSPFVALERRGFVFWNAPRTCDANPRFIGPPRPDGRRFAFAVYWLRDTGPAD